MFFSRLKWFTIGMIAIALVIVGRLIDVQVVRAAYYESLADRMLTRPLRYLPAPRGSILDRNGRVLISDEPTSDISVHYTLLKALISDAENTSGVLLSAADYPPDTQQYLRAVARQLRKLGETEPARTTDQIVTRLVDRVRAMWDRLSDLSGESYEELVARARRIRDRTELVKRYILRQNPTVRSIAEEQQLHPLIRSVSADTALAVRLELEQYRWLRVVPSSRRVAHQVDPLVHLLGRTGATSPQRIESDRLRDDHLRALRPGDVCGISGVERLAELALRGSRGYIAERFDGTTEQHIKPVRGRDVRLTIDADVQAHVLGLLEQAVKRSIEQGEHPAAGASAVVIDVWTREILALANYPTYGYDEYRGDYAKLRADARWQPLRARAVANVYPPGSPCKLIGLYGALADGLITPETEITCNGHYLPNQPDKFRCWYYKQFLATHGPQTPEEAIQNSCNIFFYTIGEQLGPERLCEWFGRFGFGRTQGTGLIEEARGTLPNAAWMQRTQGRRHRRADAWNFSIGQGEIGATPLQCANVAATIASGTWAPVEIIRTEPGDPVLPRTRPETTHFQEPIVRLLRAGMWRVVNDDGTGKQARLDHPDHELCGKTGSAQANPRPLTNRWTIEWPDGTREQIIANRTKTRAEVLADFPPPRPKIVGRHTQDRFPHPAPDGSLPSHAWFIGFSQAKSTPRGAAPRGKVFALSVIIEYGGSGGKVAGPVAKQIIEYLLGTQAEWGARGTIEMKLTAAP